MNLAWEATRSTMMALAEIHGAIITEEHEKARKAICDGCEYKGNVEPYPSVILPGCTECGCPFETKRKMSQIGIRKIRCSHPEGNLWEETDFEFLTKKNNYNE
jgi:hypothetical protein